MPAITLGPRVRKSPFFDGSIRQGALSFTIYNHMFMPTSYHPDSELEFSRVINGVQIWDVGCERQVQITGPDTMQMAQLMTPRNLSNCEIGQCKYALITDQDGGVINDPVMVRLGSQHVWFSLADSDMLLWAKGLAARDKLSVTIDEPDVSPLQVQGPKSRDLMRDVFGAWIDDLKFYWMRELELDGIPLVVARSGYSKELCYEIYLRDGQYGDKLWDRLFEVGQVYNVTPGAPSQILRVEGGILSYGTDMRIDNNPYEINMGWTIDLDQTADFIGKQALARINQDGVTQRLLGAVLEGDKMTKFNEEYWPAFADDVAAGHLTTCTYSPRLAKNLGFVMAKAAYAIAGQVLEIRSPAGSIRATLCELPFIKDRKE
jgi:glycine cleavage system aminomethyltransferase T